MPKRNPLMCWKVHAPGLLQEIVKHSGQDIYRIPLNMFAKLLYGVAREAARINDPELNALMCKLALYAIADPYDKENYNPKQMDRIIRQADKIQRQRLSTERKHQREIHEAHRTRNSRV